MEITTDADKSSQPLSAGFDFAQKYNVPAANLSFELFPPQNCANAPKFWQAVDSLTALKPKYLSLTCGADGSSHERTLTTVEALVRATQTAIAPHITCVTSKKGATREQAEHYWSLGIRHLVVLRGDEKKENQESDNRTARLKDVFELMDEVRHAGNFEISVAAYPEVHPKARSAEHDLEHLRRKLDAGASRAITQFCFDHERFVDFFNRCEQHDMTSALVPGILPIKDLDQTRRFATMCDTRIPTWLSQKFKGLKNDKDTRELVAASVVIDQVRALHALGLRQFHLYTLNAAPLTLAACQVLGVRPDYEQSDKGIAA